MVREFLTDEKARELEIIFNAFPETVQYTSAESFLRVCFAAELPPGKFEGLLGTNYPEISFCKIDHPAVSKFTKDSFQYSVSFFEFEGSRLLIAIQIGDEILRTPLQYEFNTGGNHIVGLLIPFTLYGEVIATAFYKYENECVIVIDKRWIADEN